MSTGPNDQRLAGGYIDITTRGTEKVQQEVKATTAVVETQVAAAAAATEQGASRQNAANESAVKGWKRFASSITSTIASFTALAAVLGIVVGSITRFVNGLRDSNIAAAKFIENLKTANIAQAIGEITTKVSELNEAEGALSVRSLSDSIGLTAALGFRTVREEIEELEAASRRLSNVDPRRTGREDRQHFADQVDALESMLHRRRMARMREEFDERRKRTQEEYAERVRLEEEIAEFDKRRLAGQRASFDAIVKAIEEAFREAARQQDAFNNRQAVALERIAESTDLTQRRLAVPGVRP